MSVIAEALPVAVDSTLSPAPPTEVLLPALGRPISQFAQEVGQILAPSGQWFVKAERVVRLRELQVCGPAHPLAAGTSSMVFHYPTPNELRSSLESSLQPGIHQRQGNNWEFVPQSMGRDTAAALLEAPQLKSALPTIRRILDVPIPVDIGGLLQWSQIGYDPRLQTFCKYAAPAVVPLPLIEAKAVVDELLQGFCFANDQSRVMAIARLLTPMCRALMGWDSRPPLWVFEANRPRAGKDYLAGCTGILYEGRANEDAPLDHDSNETSKRIVAALQSGRRFMHFANSSGDIRNDAFEQAVTTKVLSRRLLGSNDAASDLTLPNELEYSVSGNTGFSFTEDFALRCRRISLAYFDEDANGRTFPKTDLHGWIRDNRGRILGAMAGLIWEWNSQGRPSGPTPFSSFPEWARVVGGIMVACGSGDPCLPQIDGTFTQDRLTEDMKTLFRIAQLAHPSESITRQSIRDLVTGRGRSTEEIGLDLFPQWDLDDRKGQSAFGKAIQKYKGRILGGIRMEVDESDRSRPKYMFVIQPMIRPLCA